MDRYSNLRYPNPAFVFDIDGVFLKGGTLIPRAKEAFLLVKERKVPYIFLRVFLG